MGFWMPGGEVMKAALLVLLLASPVFAQEKMADAATAPGCGDEKIKFAVRTDNTERPTAQPEAGKALVYFVEDDSEFASIPRPTTRSGIDGNWVGATHGNSYFYVSVDPGEHHLCATWQRRVIMTGGLRTAAAHFTAEAGQVYYFKIKNTWNRAVGTANISLKPLDSDEWLILEKRLSFSRSRPKK
jgi:hypothetical protein